MINWNEYTALFDAVLEGQNTSAPYDKESYLEYVKLNHARQNRWLKKLELSEETLASLAAIDAPQKWIVISEPWCGDAAHCLPFIWAMSERSERITLAIELRDSEPRRITNYLTNGGESIPKLIVQNEAGQDLFTWGPRPAECQQLMLDMKDRDIPAIEKKAALQKWYNKDKGIAIQDEIVAGINAAFTIEKVA